MFDYHMHTIFSDGKNSIEEMIETAERLSLKTIAITDHIWQSSQWFFDYCALIKQKNKMGKLTILIGFEAKALSVNGEIDATQSMCNEADIKIGAIHRIPAGDKLNHFLTREEVSEDKDKAYFNWLQTTINLIKNKNVDIVAHPCMVLDKYNLEKKEEDILNLFILAKKYNKKLEISSRYKKSNLILINAIKNNPNFLPFISYGSDAHSIEDLVKAHQ